MYIMGGREGGSQEKGGKERNVILYSNMFKLEVRVEKISALSLRKTKHLPLEISKEN